MSADGTISAGCTEPEPDWVDEMSWSDFIDSMPDPDRRNLVEEYARRNGIDLSNPLREARPVMGRIDVQPPTRLVDDDPRGEVGLGQRDVGATRTAYDAGGV